MLILALAGYFLLVIFDLRPLYKKKHRRDFWVDIVLGILSFTIAVLLCLGVKFPSPVRPIRDFITSIFGK